MPAIERYTRVYEKTKPKITNNEAATFLEALQDIERDTSPQHSTTPSPEKAASSKGLVSPGKVVLLGGNPTELSTEDAIRETREIYSRL